jgi:YegS/Rv2252/BmrU family lipid kinase
MNHLFIVNPAAGGKKNRHEETFKHISSIMSEYSEPYEIYITKAPMDACDKVKAEAASCDRLRVYACGGDGTLNECINGAAGFSHVAVTHYPTGTGNDFVKMFGPEDEAKFRDLRLLLGGFERPVDLIELQTPAGDGRFGVNICSVGIDARIGTDVHKYSRIPLIGGATGHVVSMFVNLMRGVNQRLKITTAELSLDGSFALVCACNGRFYGGGFNPVPEALPDDGIIEFLIVKEVTRLKFIRVVGKYAKGKYREFSDIITHLRGNTMRIESETELAVNVDGELIRAKDIIFKLIRGGVNFFFPSGMVFFKSRDMNSAAISSKREI